MAPRTVRHIRAAVLARIEAEYRALDAVVGKLTPEDFDRPVFGEGAPPPPPRGGARAVVPRIPPSKPSSSSTTTPMEPGMRRVRDIILAADPRVTEAFKWKTPTFGCKGQHALRGPGGGRGRPARPGAGHPVLVRMERRTGLMR